MSQLVLSHFLSYQILLHFILQLDCTPLAKMSIWTCLVTRLLVAPLDIPSTSYFVHPMPWYNVFIDTSFHTSCLVTVSISTSPIMTWHCFGSFLLIRTCNVHSHQQILLHFISELLNPWVSITTRNQGTPLSNISISTKAFYLIRLCRNIHHRISLNLCTITCLDDYIRAAWLL